MNLLSFALAGFMLVPAQLSQFYTDLGQKDPGGRSNIYLAAAKMNNIVLQPHEVFSFNKVVGDTNKPSAGWKESLIIDNGNYAKGYGGGVCQVSSTLFNAVRAAHIPVIERHVHSKKVSYLPKGQDATVVYPEWDLKFRNIKKHPIRINAAVINNQLLVTIAEE